MGQKWNAILRGDIKPKAPFLTLHPLGVEWSDQELKEEIQDEWREDARAAWKKNRVWNILFTCFLVASLIGIVALFSVAR